MKSQTIKKRYAHGLLFLLPLLLTMASCIKEPAANDPQTLPPVPDGKVRLELRTNTSDYQTPVTRGENDISGDIWVLVFKQAGGDTNLGNATFVEAVQGENTSGTCTVTLTKQTAACRILVIANVAANPAASLTAGTTTFATATAANSMLTVQLTSPVSPSPYSVINDNIPMSAAFDATGGIDNSTVIKNDADGKLYLKRIVAKVTVKLAESLPLATLELTGASVTNVAQQGAYYPGSYSAAGVVNYSPNIVSAATGGKTMAAPIFIYPTGTASNPSVIIAAKYNGSAATYYRLAFKGTDGTVIPVEANKHYEFTVSSANVAGYATAAEAIAAPPSNNITAEITVTDLSSHEIADNGQYYLAVSNSEFIYYGAAESSINNVVKITVGGDLTGVTTKTISITGTGGIISPATYTMTTTGTGETTIDLTSWPKAATAGTITIKLGNLTKTVVINRKAAPSGYSASVLTDFSTGGYVVAEKANAADTWLRLGSAAGSFSDGTVLQNNGIWLGIAKNPGTTVSDTRSADVYLYRDQSVTSAKVKMRVVQGPDNFKDIEIKEPTSLPTARYVGAFWCASETGERVIRIPMGTAPANLGDWTATVAWMDDRWNDGDIVLDAPDQSTITLPTADLSQLNAEAAANMNAGWIKDATATSVSGSVVSGTTTDKTNYIYFRIGLKSKFTPTAAYPARYAVILITCGPVASVKNFKLYLRQGEAADYLMRPEDLGGTGTSWGTPNRPLAAKYSPYNLTAPSFKGSGTQIQSVKLNKQDGTGGTETGTWTDYPSQAGAFFQWAHTNGVYAFNPAVPTSTIPSNFGTSNTVTGVWDGTIGATYESCPAGYRRPTDGDITTHHTATTPAVSEMAQSLWWKPQNNGTNNVENVGWGYYADGFFDRRIITNQAAYSGGATTGTAVSTNNSTVAYVGQLFYNPNNNASIFFPASGYRNSSSGYLYNTGASGYYWSSGSSSTTSAWTLSVNGGNANRYSTSRHNGFSVRCVLAE